MLAQSTADSVLFAHRKTPVQTVRSNVTGVMVYSKEAQRKKTLKTREKGSVRRSPETP